jgi:CheY-like chemotaxis protein
VKAPLCPAERNRMPVTKILLVDDDKLLNTIMRSLLERDGLRHNRCQQRCGSFETDQLKTVFQVMIIADEVDSQLRKAMECHVEESLVDSLPA